MKSSLDEAKTSRAPFSAFVCLAHLLQTTASTGRWNTTMATTAPSASLSRLSRCVCAWQASRSPHRTQYIAAPSIPQSMEETLKPYRSIFTEFAQPMVRPQHPHTTHRGSPLCAAPAAAGMLPRRKHRRGRDGAHSFAISCEAGMLRSL